MNSVSWKTNSTGVLMIIGALVHLGFVVKSGTLTESDVMGAAAAIVAGFGLVSARDWNVTSADLGLHKPDDSNITIVSQPTATGTTNVLKMLIVGVLVATLAGCCYATHDAPAPGYTGKGADDTYKAVTAERHECIIDNNGNHICK